MSKEKKQKNQKSEIKLIIIFLLVLAASYVGGYFFGTMGARYEDTMKELLQVVAGGATLVFPMFYVFVNALVIVASLVIYIVARNKAALWDGESEEVIDGVEKRLNWSVTLINILMIADIFFYGVMVYISAYTTVGESFDDELFILGTVTFLVSYALMMVLYKLIMDLVKKLNPEKRGSVFDIKFLKEWEDSCDEAEKLTMYKAAYKTYHIVSAVCMLMWMLSFGGMLLFQTGLLPMFCVSAIWVTMVATYSIVCAQLEAKR